MTAADLRHIETWLFDLDNTLYPSESGLAARMEPKITDYVMRVANLPRHDAYVLQKRYLAEHGLTLKGLMLHYGVDPDEYHAQFADIALDCLAPDASLRSALARLPGRRLIFTNADGGHAARVLARLELDDLFDEVFHIASAAFEPKPALAAFRRIIDRHGVTPSAAAFFEDSARNLEPAAHLGMTTVLVGTKALGSGDSWVHYRTETLAPFLAESLVQEMA